MNNHFKIIVPFYNVEQWVKLTIRSIQMQNYKNFECILVDDISTDQSRVLAEKEINVDKRFKIVENKAKKYVLKNICDAIELANPNQEDIIVILDGDDWFARKDVLSILNETYNRENCWLTYGSYVEYPSNTRGKFASRVPEHVINNNLFRNVPWKASHLRTFKRKLWNNIRKEDLINLDTLEFYEVAWDLAFMYPMLEMSGPRSRHVADYMYVYNKENPLSDMYIKQQQQLNAATQIINRPKYSQKEF